ncbi:MAG: hypothetical protein IPJ75_05395 [Ignavibacteriales bacterium]|nr:hypothetical protein [Ignavibacteriales bacterium]
MPDDKKDLIFEEFRQVSEGFSRGFEGPGLGLTISKRITELMNGTIKLESTLGKGSTLLYDFHTDPWRGWITIFQNLNLYFVYKRKSVSFEVQIKLNISRYTGV